ncbi:RNA polymerase sigma factor [Pseudenhygromyxa sp. WMMC2535]|nr:RNA polymerase sigma factor [Pseudenhygromyxa sp. WMMC2535]NVB43328.1 RNA polymerase sigma factor [Pseudenhygromyxa sp. WMMC2535]
MAAWREGDRRAGSRLIDRHFSALYRFFANKVGRSEEAEELVQRTFIGATEGLVRFREDASVRTWLFAIARNVLRQWIDEQVRRRGREVDPGSLSFADLGAGASSIMAKRREQRLLLEALRRLPIESQLVLELAYWEQLKAREIAVVIDSSEANTRNKLRTAKQELRANLDALARSREELESTLSGLEGWARGLREVWGR